MNSVKQISVHDLKSKIDKKDNFVLIDVRQPDEFEIASIQGAKLIPLNEFPQRAVSEISKDASVVIHCHHGGRSQRACEYLASLGYEDLSNLAGGIDAWAVEIDKSVRRY